MSMLLKFYLHHGGSPVLLDLPLSAVRGKGSLSNRGGCIDVLYFYQNGHLLSHYSLFGL